MKRLIFLLLFFGLMATVMRADDIKKLTAGIVHNFNEEVDSKNKATCVDQAKYDDCVDYYQSISTAPDFSISDYCRDQAKKRCNDK